MQVKVSAGGAGSLIYAVGSTELYEKNSFARLPIVAEAPPTRVTVPVLIVIYENPEVISEAGLSLIAAIE